jgi:hypothetical protein
MRWSNTCASRVTGVQSPGNFGPPITVMVGIITEPSAGKLTETEEKGFSNGQTTRGPVERPALVS